MPLIPKKIDFTFFVRCFPSAFSMYNSNGKIKSQGNIGITGHLYDGLKQAKVGLFIF